MCLMQKSDDGVNNQTAEFSEFSKGFTSLHFLVVVSNHFRTGLELFSSLNHDVLSRRLFTKSLSINISIGDTLSFKRVKLKIISKNKFNQKPGGPTKMFAG